MVLVAPASSQTSSIHSGVPPDTQEMGMATKILQSAFSLQTLRAPFLFPAVPRSGKPTHF